MKNAIAKIETETRFEGYQPLVDLRDFRLTAEPTLDAIKNDISKFYTVSVKGADMVLLGRFLLGVSLLKAKKIVGNASRGRTHNGEGGWLDWKKKSFPDLSNNALTDAVNFARECFHSWTDDKGSKSKICKVQNLENDPVAFQLPENPQELDGLLSAIHSTMNGAKMTAFCRSIGRIRDAVPAGSKSTGRKALTDEEKAALDPLSEIEGDLIGLADPKDLTFADLNSARLTKFQDALIDCLNHVQSVLKSRKRS